MVCSQKRARKNRSLASIRLWRIALYIRLSKEDGHDESLSVANQRKILREFVQNNFEGEYVLPKERIKPTAIADKT